MKRHSIISRLIGLTSPLGKWLLLICIGMFANSVSAQQCQSSQAIWADEFDGTSLDTNKWEPMIGDGCSFGICGWGNNELQSYKAENATVSGGILTITAKKERVKGSAYTSARLRTANMPNGGEWTNGRFEARIKLPDGTGMWPAFWMLPTDPSVGWPESGEIDILEATGQADMFAFGTIHYGQPWPDNEWTGNRILKQPDSWSDGFHEYAVEWEPNEMRWYVDDILYSVKTPADLSDPAFWTFENYQYHFLLNIAVGGNIGGSVDDSMLPQTMDVDYVRVYDFGQPSLNGEHLVEPGSTHSYSIIDEAGTGSSYNWSVPAGATIIAGAGSDSIMVDWGSTGGDVSVTVNSSCGSSNLVANVYVAPALGQEFVHDDFESNRNLGYTTFTGAFDQAASNPAPNAVNDSIVVGQYIRNSAEQWDVIAGDSIAISDVAPYITGDKAFYMDMYTAAPIGTEILIQLEDSSIATPSNFPTGRHSKYIAHTSKQNSWESLKFKLEDRIDGATGDLDVNSIIILIDPNSFNGDTYYVDNFDSYGTGSVGNTQPIASLTSSCNDLACDFDGSSSSDSDGSIVSYDWDFGDGSTATGVAPNHTYAAAGDFTVTLTVTDNEGATDIASSLVSVTVVSGPATAIHVSNVTTGTQGAGAGNKYGIATINVLDNLGFAASGVTVTGTFSGTWNESNSGITDTSGNVTILTGSTSKGNVIVNFCVDSLAGSLPHDASASIGLCP